MMIQNNMSHEINTQLEEELAELETDYADDLKALHQAEEEMREAHSWLQKRIDCANNSAKILLNFKQRMQHD